MGAGASRLGEAKNRPVSKVVTLLKDMSNQLEKEAESDEDVYDQMACWCTTNDKEKTKAIANGEQRIVDLSSSIEEGQATASGLNAQITAANQEIAKNTNALDQATSLRQSQLADFNDEEKEMLTSIGALKSAVTVLGKHHEAMLQASKAGAEVKETAEDSVSLINVGLMLKSQLHKHLDILGETMTPTQTRLISSFTEVDTPMNAGSYAPASGAVFGIIKNMKESFEANLAASQKEEHTNQEAYEQLKKAKNEQIAAGNTQVQDKTTQLGEAQEKVANDKEDLEDTQNTLAADQDFLANLKQKCEMFDAEFEARSTTRKQEIAAVAKAMAILSGDDAHALFSKTFNPAFLQKAASQDNSARREKAYAVLVKTARQTHSPKLASLALKVRLNGFSGIKKSLEDMIAQLDKEKEDEVDLKDFCIDEMNRNERESEETDRDKERTVAKIEDLTSTIDTLTSAINELKAEVAELQMQMSKAGEVREEGNREFQTTVADQRATQKLLTQALNVLKGFYKAALLRTSASVGQEPAGPPPPPDFKAYENNNASGGVMGMLQQIINDAKAMEAQAIKGEEDAQSAYEGFVTETNNSINALSEDITNKSENRAQAEADKTESSTNLDATMRQLEYLANENSDLHSQCDFTLKNFDVRQAARDDEVEALKQSIAILSGAKAFLQKQ
jgi:chromosome segregation ATPase